MRFLKSIDLRPKDIVVGILLIAWFLAVLTPVFSIATGKPADQTRFGISYGIPTQWYASARDERPACTDVPENSIGLDFLSIERCIYTFGSDSEIYAYGCPCDPFHRPYIYPPFLTFLFSWTPWFSPMQGIAIWSALILVLILGCSFFWMRWWRGFVAAEGVSGQAGNRSSLLAACLMTLSYPSLFSFERGNQDPWVLLLLTLAGRLWIRESWFGVGFVLMAAGFLKVYPMPLALTTGLIFTGMLLLKSVRARAVPIAGKCAAGLAVSAAFFLAAFWKSSIVYLTKALPAFADRKPAVAQSVHSHSLSIAWGSAGVALFACLWAAATAVLAIAVYRRLRHPDPRGLDRRDILMHFTFLVGVSVYLANTSFDYNLILWFPFMSLFLSGAEVRVNPLQTAGVAALAAGCFLPRWLQGAVWPAAPVSLYLMLQLVGITFWLTGGLVRPASSRLRLS